MAKWTKNHMMEIGIVLAAVGLVLTAISWTDSFADTTPGWLQGYHDALHQPKASGAGEDNYNLVVFIAGPILLIIGAFYFGEQIVLRRRFERLIDTPKKSEFVSRRRDLDELTRRLPDQFNQRVKAKEDEFAATGSRRSA